MNIKKYDYLIDGVRSSGEFVLICAKELPEFEAVCERLGTSEEVSEKGIAEQLIRRFPYCAFQPSIELIQNLSGNKKKSIAIIKKMKADEIRDHKECVSYYEKKISKIDIFIEEIARWAPESDDLLGLRSAILNRLSRYKEDLVDLVVVSKDTIVDISKESIESYKSRKMIEARSNLIRYSAFIEAEPKLTDDMFLSMKDTINELKRTLMESGLLKKPKKKKK